MTRSNAAASTTGSRTPPSTARWRSCAGTSRTSASGWPATSPAVVGGLREADLLKPPGVAETIDWTQALHVLGSERLDDGRAVATLGAAVKYHEDQVRVQRDVLPELLARLA